MEQIPETMITASLVADAKRMQFLPRYFDRYLAIFERQLYGQMNKLTADYHGGFWEFFELSNGGCYLAPSGDDWYRILVDGNGYDGTVQAPVAGLIATLFTLSHLSFRFPSVALFADRFYQLRDYAAQHPKRRQIFAAID